MDLETISCHLIIRFRYFLIVKAVLENLSAGTDAAGMLSKPLAIFDSNGKGDSFAFHHVNIFTSLGDLGC